jgi:hypothetical protein
MTGFRRSDIRDFIILEEVFFCVFSTFILIELSDKYAKDYFAQYNNGYLGYPYDLARSQK